MFSVKANGKDKEAINVFQREFGPDTRDYSHLIIEKPWGREFQVAATDKYSVWRMELNPDSETSMHCHVGKDTLLIVFEGSIEFSTLEDTIHMNTGDQVEIEKGAFHKSATKTGAVLLEIERPPNKHDLIRLSDKYGRQGKGYEE